MAYFKPREPTVLYDVDFSTFTPQNLLGDGNYVIDGYTWTVANSSAASLFEINGSGLVITANGGSNKYADSVRNSALIYSPVINWLPNLDFTKLRFMRVFAKVALTNMNADFKFFKIGFEIAEQPAWTSAVHGLVYNAGIQLYAQIDPRNTPQYTIISAGSTDTLGVSWTPPFSMDFLYGVYSNGWPPTNTNVSYSCRLLTSSYASSEMRFVITAGPHNAGTSVTATVTNFRIEAAFR